MTADEVLIQCKYEYTVTNEPFLVATPCYVDCFCCQSDVTLQTVEFNISLKYIEIFDENVGKFSK